MEERIEEPNPLQVSDGNGLVANKAQPFSSTRRIADLAGDIVIDESDVARQLIDGASFGPDALKAIGQAFDAAWEEIASNFGTDPNDRQRQPRRHQSSSRHSRPAAHPTDHALARSGR